MTEPKTPVDDSLPLIGWREWLSFPDLGIPGIKAKIDTGARSSCLHTHDYEIFEKDGAEWTRFHLHPLVDRSELMLTCEAPVVDRRVVKDSGGHEEERLYIETTAFLGKFSFPIQLNLSNREGMKFRMLLGRVDMAQRFTVAPGRSYVASQDLHCQYDVPNPQ